QVGEARKLLADLLAHRLLCVLVPEESAKHLDDLVEEPLMAPIIGEGTQELGCERSKLHLLVLLDDAGPDETAKPGVFVCLHRFWHEARHEMRQAASTARLRKPIGHQGGEINLPQLLANRCGREEINFDETTQIVS